MEHFIFVAAALSVVGIFWTVRPGIYADGVGVPAESFAFLQDKSGWAIGLMLGVLAAAAASAASQTDEIEFRVAMIGFAVFGAGMAAGEIGRRLRHLRKMAPASRG